MWLRLDDGWNTYKFSARIYIHIFFGRCAVVINRRIKCEVAVRFAFRHVSFVCRARITRWCFVSSARNFEDLKPKFFSIYFTFPPLAFFPLVCSLSRLLVFRWVFLHSFPFLRFIFSIALDPLHPSLRNFFVGVCRVSKSEGRPICFGDLIQVDCVLRRLSEKLFALAFSAINTWRSLRGRMASERSSWPQVRSDELPEGLMIGRMGGTLRMKPRQSRARPGVMCPKSFG